MVLLAYFIFHVEFTNPHNIRWPQTEGQSERIVDISVDIKIGLYTHL